MTAHVTPSTSLPASPAAGDGPVHVPVPPSASTVILRARALAAYANGIDADVTAHAAAIPDEDFHAWRIFYAQQASPAIDPYTDPAFGIVAHPLDAWASFDAIEPTLDVWRRKVNAWTGLDHPVIVPMPLPSVPVPYPDHAPWEPDPSTKLLIGLGLVVILVVAWKALP